jgi:hypothetical protein
MTSMPGLPKVARGGFVLVDPGTGRALKTIPFQYNPDTLTRTLQPQGIGSEPGNRLEALRLKGPPHETYKLDAEFDAADQLSNPDGNPVQAANGLYPVLSALELSIYPDVSQLIAEDQMAALGMIEVAAVEAPLTVLVLGQARVLPVRLTDLTITEEAFDTQLNPIRAKVSLSARVLTVDDLGFAHRGGLLYLSYHRGKAQYAALVTRTPEDLGLKSF